MAYPAPYVMPVAVPQDSRTIQELSMPIYQARGWLKFLGVLSILGGIGTALALVGILPIWMGVLMFQAGSNITTAAQTGDRISYLKAMGALKTFFVLQGVLALLGIVLAIVMTCIAFILPLLGITLFPSIQNIINGIFQNLNF